MKVTFSATGTAQQVKESIAQQARKARDENASQVGASATIYGARDYVNGVVAGLAPEQKVTVTASLDIGITIEKAKEEKGERAKKSEEK